MLIVRPDSGVCPLSISVSDEFAIFQLDVSLLVLGRFSLHSVVITFLRNSFDFTLRIKLSSRCYLHSDDFPRRSA